MINYDSHRWKEFARINGSVLPGACLYAVLPAALAVFLKVLDNEKLVTLSQWGFLQETQAFTLFTGTVAFLLVFRTGQCYSRFVDCSSSIFTMRAQLYEAYSSLVAFTVMSKKPSSDIDVFKDKLIHLFSMCHACILASVADEHHGSFDIVDLDHVPSRYVHALQELKPSRRVDLAYQWISNAVVREISSGLLNVPPPILSRIFQEMEKAMIEYNNIVRLMVVQVPFPYAQGCVILMFIFMITMPIVVVSWTDQAAAAGIFTFLSCACFLSMEMISAELENPFGDDANDLPVTQFQEEFNEGLLLLLHPSLDHDFVLKRHEKRVVRDRHTWHTLDDHHDIDESQDLRSFEPARQESEVVGTEYSMEEVDTSHSRTFGSSAVNSQSAADVTQQSPSAADSSQPTKSPEKEEAVKKRTEVPESGPPKVMDLPKGAQATPPAVPEASWMTQFARKQSQFENDVLSRLDKIVTALASPRYMPQKQTGPHLSQGSQQLSQGFQHSSHDSGSQPAWSSSLASSKDLLAVPDESARRSLQRPPVFAISTPRSPRTPGSSQEMV